MTPPARTVLVVDHDPEFRCSLENVLGPLGYQILTADSVEQACAILQAKPVDAVLFESDPPIMSGIAFYDGKLFPAWQGNLFVSALVGKSLVRLVLNGDRVVGEERLLTELNARIRGVNEGPDGALYVLTDGSAGRLIRLVPK